MESSITSSNRSSGEKPLSKTGEEISVRTKVADMPDPDLPYPIDGWKKTYIPPGVCKNPTSFWQLPPTRQIIQNLKACGGDPGDLLVSISPDDEKLRQLLLMQIYERLQGKKNEKHLAEWKRITSLSDKCKLRIGLSKYLAKFKDDGDAKNTTLIGKLGTAAMPEAFTEQPLQKEKESGSKSALEGLMNDLG